MPFGRKEKDENNPQQKSWKSTFTELSQSVIVLVTFKRSYSMFPGTKYTIAA